MPNKQKRRNGYAFHPIMLKGGVHEKSKKAKRRAVKQETLHLAKEWLDRSDLQFDILPLKAMFLSFAK